MASMRHVMMVQNTMQMVTDETGRPTPTEYPPLLATLQTSVGMVLRGGEPRTRTPYLPSLSDEVLTAVSDQAARLRSQCHALCEHKDGGDSKRIDMNSMACSLPITKNDLLQYIERGKRLDTEQAVGMVIAYLAHLPLTSESNDLADDFEGRDTPVINELINDAGTVDMLEKACMWRAPRDFDLLTDPREASLTAGKNKILHLLGEEVVPDAPPNTEFTGLLQTLRRRRSTLDNSQHLVIPDKLLTGDQNDEPWTIKHAYVYGKQKPIPTTTVRVLPKRKFKIIQRILLRMQDPTDVTAVYVLDVERFINSSGVPSPQRLAVLEASQDPYAVAYSFIAAQRQLQLRVVSDHKWTRFLVKGEGKLLLQNRPDRLTSFEDILLRRATDLVALTAVRCPEGVKDHFSSHQEIKDRARGVCELMERYVKEFGLGKTENLVFEDRLSGGRGRGPVDLYNKLCDELRDCSFRAKAMNVKLGIGPVHKFLAWDIMYFNDAWADDAFAGGKMPGWMEYLARVRGKVSLEEVNLEEISLEDSFHIV